MSSETEKMLSSALKVFNTKLCERQVVKLEGMEDYLKVPQYMALVNLEKKAAQLETDAMLRVMNSKIAYLKAAAELRACERRWLEEIRNGMDSLEERNRIVKDVNAKMRKGDYTVLQPAGAVAAVAAAAAAVPQSSPRTARNNTAFKPPVPRRLEAAQPAPEAAPATTRVAKPELNDIKKRLAMLSMDMTPRSPLQPIHANKTVQITDTPKGGPTLSSKGSVDGSLIPNRAPTTPLSHSKWNVPAPNFDDTIDTETINPLLRGAPSHRPLPSVLLKSSDDERDEAEDTFPIVRPSLPFQTPTVPNSRPFLLSSLRTQGATTITRNDEGALPPRPTPTPVSSSSARPHATVLPVRPTPTPVSSSRPTAADPLNSLGLMQLKRPILNSEVGKKLMGQL